MVQDVIQQPNNMTPNGLFHYSW